MFVSKLRELRMARNWTQKFLAEKANLTQSTIYFIENDVKGTKFHTIEAIASALNINPYELIAYKCEDFEACNNPEKKRYDCYTKEKCEKYKEIVNYAKNIVGLALTIFIISNIKWSLCQNILAYIGFLSPH